MKIPILVLFEIDTENIPDYKNKLPRYFNQVLAETNFSTEEPAVCFRFFEGVTYKDVEYFLGESKESEHIVEAWFNEED